MGLTNNSTGIGAINSGLEIKKHEPEDKIIALAGNPNVGKSTVFNNLTGMNQHTGNWPGKTVATAQGYCKSANNSFIFVDIPGTYSLMANSAEEEVAANFICFGNPDATVVVCDATCLERNLNLVLQTMEISKKVIVCINLIDEAKRKNIKIDIPELSARLGVPVISTTARKKKTLISLLSALDNLVDTPPPSQTFTVKYIEPIENAVSLLEPVLESRFGKKINTRWLSLRLLEGNDSLIAGAAEFLGAHPLDFPEVRDTLARAKSLLYQSGIADDTLNDKIVSGLLLTAEGLCNGVVEYEAGYNDIDRKLDKLFTSRYTGYPIMIALLLGVFWLTIVGANYPSGILSDLLFGFQDWLSNIFYRLSAPQWLHGALVLGVYRVLAWVIAVMLPPMAIFFPIFTLLEDSGYLPRIAYNLDNAFKKCSACGKQALTMCMGFGCNAAGVVGCRIIDSPRERLIAMLTNNFVPCNGRFPTIIAIISMFFISESKSSLNSLLSAVFLTCVILVGVLMTFIVSKLLSKTLLKGVPSFFALEMPPYRVPQVGKVIVRSIFDRTLFVLGRAAAVAAPAGLIIWLMANITLNEVSLLNHCAGFLDPFAKLIGLDGVILMAFILGIPANEIVVPVMIMAYMAQGSIIELDISALRQLLIDNGWTWLTGACTILFSLMHWPCSTTLISIKKESGSIKWTIAAFIIPTLCGILICFIFTTVARLFYF